MSKSTTGSVSWLSSIVSTLGSTIDHAHVRKPVEAAPAEIAGAGTLSHDACVLQGYFSRARGACCSYPREEVRPDGDAVPDMTAPGVDRQSRSKALVALEQSLHACRDALAECGPQLPLQCRRRIEDAVRTLETEYVRLCDAQRFLVDRRLRSARTGEADDDPEFTIVLERVVYATDQGDDVAASVAQAVQTIVAALLPYVGRPD